MQQALWLLSRLTPLAILDILLVTLILYGVLMLIRGTQADQVVRGVLIVLLTSAIVGYFFRLTIFNWLLQSIIPALLIAIPVIFQPEIRRALEQLGRTGNIINYPLHLHITTSVEKLGEELGRASALLAERGYGGLMVVERTTGLEDYIQTGTRIDGTVTAELLLQIFYKGSPLHDGAVIIRGDRIVAARCLLPLTDDVDLDPELGTRHRAALGVTESTDAICVVISEETGAISLANHGHLVRHLNDQKLRLLLTALLQTPSGLPAGIGGAGPSPKAPEVVPPEVPPGSVPGPPVPGPMAPAPPGATGTPTAAGEGPSNGKAAPGTPAPKPDEAAGAESDAGARNGHRASGSGAGLEGFWVGLGNLGRRLGQGRRTSR